MVTAVLTGRLRLMIYVLCLNYTLQARTCTLQASRECLATVLLNEQKPSSRVSARRALSLRRTYLLNVSIAQSVHAYAGWPFVVHAAKIGQLDRCIGLVVILACREVTTGLVSLCARVTSREP